MRLVVKVIGRIVRFVALAVVVALRIALAAVLAVITPIVMPILALLSGGGLLVTIGFACAGYWHDALKGLCACLFFSICLAVLAALAQAVNPYSFSRSVVVSNQYNILDTNP